MKIACEHQWVNSVPHDPRFSGVIILMLNYKMNRSGLVFVTPGSNFFKIYDHICDKLLCVISTISVYVLPFIGVSTVLVHEIGTKNNKSFIQSLI